MHVGMMIRFHSMKSNRISIADISYMLGRKMQGDRCIDNHRTYQEKKSVTSYGKVSRIATFITYIHQ